MRNRSPDPAENQSRSRRMGACGGTRGPGAEPAGTARSRATGACRPQETRGLGVSRVPRRNSGSKLLREVGALAEATAQIVLPRRCVSCHAIVRATEVFCAPCGLTIEPVPDPCSICGQPEGQPICAHCCDARPPFERVIAPLVYGGALSAAVMRLKYERLAHCAGPLGSLLAQGVEHRLQLLDRQTTRVVPVPLHRLRLRQRGFNQATLLARRLARYNRLKLCCGALKRARDTAPQSRQANPGARRRNVQDAFEASARQVAGRTVVLVDDVVTTGATAGACAEALLRAGCSRVIVIALARTRFDGAMSACAASQQ
jgi:ComF family protein